MTGASRIFLKLDRPPSGPNFSRFIHTSEFEVAKRVVKFVLNSPRFDYRVAMQCAKDRIEQRITFSNAEKAIERIASPLSRRHNASFIRAFFAHDEARRYSGSNPVGFDRGYYQVSRDIRVPISPISVINEESELLSVFCCGWSDLSEFVELQRRFYVSMCEDAFLSQTDYERSPSEYLFFPQAKKTIKQVTSEAEPVLPPLREVEVWKRDKYALFSKAEMNELIEIYLAGRELAREHIYKLASEGRFDDIAEDGGEANPNVSQLNLFRD